jgi:hypothetical protein
VGGFRNRGVKGSAGIFLSLPSISHTHFQGGNGHIRIPKQPNMVNMVTIRRKRTTPTHRQIAAQINEQLHTNNTTAQQYQQILKQARKIGDDYVQELIKWVEIRNNHYHLPENITIDP